MQRRRRVGISSRCIIGAFSVIMAILWLSMHAMLKPPPLSAGTRGASVLPPSSVRKPPPLEVLGRQWGPEPIGPADLTPADVSRLGAILGPTASNVTRGRFITIPDWVTKGPGPPPAPCLRSPKTGVNVFLFEDGWRDEALGGARGTQCPLPQGGQRPLPAGSSPEVSVVLAFRDLAPEAIRSLISVVHNAKDVGSVEVLLLDIASRWAILNPLNQPP